MNSAISHDGVIMCKHFPVAGPFWWESTGNRWIPFTKAGDADLSRFLWSAPEHADEQTIETPVINDTIAFVMVPM